MRRALALGMLLAACGGPAITTPPAASTTTTGASSFAAEARTILEELVAVDTSHGHETDAVRPIGERLRQAGVPFELVEPEPGRGSLIARLKGSGAKRPLLLLAHIDVVPVDGQPWTVPPFTPTRKDGFLSGRGVGDDKAMAAAFSAIVLELARKKTPVARDVILALTAGEETGGFVGVQWLVKNRRDLVDAEIALNEGGGLLTNADSTAIQAASIGVAEKAYQSYRLRAHGKGGHSAAPDPSGDPITSLARALVKVGEHRFPARVLPEVAGMLAAAATWEKPPLSEALLRVSKTAPRIDAEDEKVLANDRAYAGAIRTTCIATMLSASPADNVLPTNADAVVNCRILPDETRAATQDALVKLIDDPAIEVTPVNDQGVGPSSPLEGVVPTAVAKVAHAMFPSARAFPSMGSGATDCRHLRGIDVRCYGISVAPSSLAEGRAAHLAHGPDERRPEKWLAPGAEYARAIVAELVR